MPAWMLERFNAWRNTWRTGGSIQRRGNAWLTGGGIQWRGSIHKWQHPQMAKKRKQEEGHLAQYAVREVQAGDGSTEDLRDVLPAQRQKHKEKEKLQEQQKWGEEKQRE